MTSVAVEKDDTSGPNWCAASDTDLLSAAAKQNQLAFAELMSRHYKAISRISWRLCAGHVDADRTGTSFGELRPECGRVVAITCTVRRKVHAVSGRRRLFRGHIDRIGLQPARVER